MKCGRKCQIYSRVVGYYTPTDNWNPGKKAEFRERKTYKVDEEELVNETNAIKEADSAQKPDSVKAEDPAPIEGQKG